MPLVFAAILPHGGEIVPQLAEKPALMEKTRSAMQEAGRRFAEAKPETVIVLDPHAEFMVPGAISVGATFHAAGILGDLDGRHIKSEFSVDTRFVESIFTEAHGFFPLIRAVGQEEGRNALLPLSWGALIPLWFTAHPLTDPRPEVVIVAPSRAVPRDTLVGFGSLLARVAENSGKRVALIASADQGHAHDANGPYGLSPKSAEYDLHYAEAVATENLDALLDWDEDFLEAAKIDSFWQTLVLAGALDHTPLKGDLLSYEAPTYFGMLVAAYAQNN